MKSLRSFIAEFIKNEGFWVFLALFSVKIFSFFTNIILIRLLPKDQFGLLAVVPAVFTVFAPLSGFGYSGALLRYGAILKKNEDRERFSAVLFQKGLRFQFFLSLIFFGTVVFYFRKYTGIAPVFAAFAIRLAGIYIFSHIQSDLRVTAGNRSFSVFTVVNTAGAFAITVLLTYFLGFWGYLLSASVCPFLCLFWLRNIKVPAIDFKEFSFREVRNFAAHSAFTNILSELLFSADLILLSFLMDENAVADYRAAILIPSNVVFLAQSFLQADYTLLASKSGDRDFLRHYIRQFYKIFLPVSVLVMIFGFFFRDELIALFFGKNYREISKSFTILMFGFSASMLLRVFWGNLLASIGEIKYNTAATAFGVLVLVIFALILVPKLGVLGMAYSMAAALFACGFALWLSFFIIFKRKV